jgi:alpha-N-arabinofuranosidase
MSFCFQDFALVGALAALVGAGAPLPAGPRSVPAARLTNPGFEAGLQGWSVHRYGAPSRVEVDAGLKHEGKQALRVSASMPSDTALGQEVMLEPGQCYRFSGWVRTRKLDPGGAPVYGTFQIQHPGGRGVIAGGASHGGDTDWTEVVIHFVAPPGGRTRIAVFFVGYGRGTGTAWFDDLQLRRVDLSRLPVKVTRAPLQRGTISPFQYGQFVEYLCDLVPAMWAEKLYDGGFEGLSPYKFVFLKETDCREKPWYPSGAVNRAEYTRDPVNPVSGAAAQKIAVKGDSPCTVGISQDGIFVERARACVFTCYLRGQGLKSPVRVRLHHEGKTLAACQFTPEGQWKKYRARLLPAATDTGATLTVSFRGPGTLWLDNASLMPEDTVGGWRPDVVQAVRALKPGIIRFGGSALDDGNLGDFEWRDTIGAPERRKPFRAWGGLQPTGAGLEEIVQFCRHVGAEPLICVRVRGRTPQDAADQVQYFNGAASTPLGELRARNGHRQPYGIKYWQVGNEQAGKKYEDRLAAFCRAMKKADPTIRVLSSYPSAGVLRRAGDVLDYVCPHHYDCANLAGVESDLSAIRALLRAHGPKRPIRVAVTEWNTTAGDAGPRRARLWSLENALACARYHNLLHRHCDLVAIANRSNLANSFCSGVVQTDNHRLFKTPTYYAQQLYATLAGNRPLRLASAVPPGLAPDIGATLSPGGDSVTVFAVNDTLQDITRPLDFSAFGATGQEVSTWTLADRRRRGEPDVANSFAEPERVVAVASKFRAGSPCFAYRFPALSVTVLRWRVGQ